MNESWENLARIDGFRIVRLLIVWSLVLSVVGTERAWADQPRVRTLEYDHVRKVWAEASPPPALGTPEGDLHAIRVQIRVERFAEALSSSKAFIKRHGRSDPLYPAVAIARAEALIGQGDYCKAHKQLKEFLDQYYVEELTAEALRLEFVIAETFLGGVKRKFLGIRMLSGVDLAQSILDDISISFPDSELAPAAIKTKADHLFKTGEHALAQMEYERLVREYPANRHVRFALRRAADAALASFAGVPYDETPLLDSEERFREYDFHYPTEADHEGVGLILDSIRSQRAAKDCAVGQYYEKTDHISSAVFYYRRVCENWPDTVAATRAKLRLELIGDAGQVPGSSMEGGGER